MQLRLYKPAPIHPINPRRSARWPTTKTQSQSADRTLNQKQDKSDMETRNPINWLTWLSAIFLNSKLIPSQFQVNSKSISSQSHVNEMKPILNNVWLIKRRLSQSRPRFHQLDARGWGRRGGGMSQLKNQSSSCHRTRGSWGKDRWSSVVYLIHSLPPPPPPPSPPPWPPIEINKRPGSQKRSNKRRNTWIHVLLLSVTWNAKGSSKHSPIPPPFTTPSSEKPLEI